MQALVRGGGGGGGRLALAGGPALCIRVRNAMVLPSGWGCLPLSLFQAAREVASSPSILSQP